MLMFAHNNYLPRTRWLIVLVSTTHKQKKLVHFCQFTKNWSESKLLTRDFVSLAARRWIVIITNEPAEQSAWKVPFTCVLYTNSWYNSSIDRTLTLSSFLHYLHMRFLKKVSIIVPVLKSTQPRIKKILIRHLRNSLLVLSPWRTIFPI